MIVVLIKRLLKAVLPVTAVKLLKKIYRENKTRPFSDKKDKFQTLRGLDSEVTVGPGVPEKSSTSGSLKERVQRQNAALKLAVASAKKMRDEGRLFEACDELLGFQANFPEENRHLALLANLLAMCGKFEMALPIFEKLIVNDPENSQLKLRKADCLTGLGQFENAARALESADLKKISSSKAVVRRVSHLRGLARHSSSPIERTFSEDVSVAGEVFKLSPVQLRVLSDLNDRGIAITSVYELLGGEQLWNDGVNAFEKFKADDSVAELISRIKNSVDFDQDDEFKGKHVPTKVPYDSFFGTLGADHPVGALFCEEKILEIAWTYHNCPTKLRNPVMWVNPSVNESNRSGKKGSQQWHRDQEDTSILKCFVYYSDVDEKTGATEYIDQSCERFSNDEFMFHPFPFSTGYPNQPFFEGVIGQPQVTKTVASGRKGSIIFLDTNGFHRGGYVTQGERLIAMATFLKETSPVTDDGKKLSIANLSGLTNFQKRTMS
ncbi:hypothetical protein AB3X55_00135 [Alphaproteobacteria bacterium LSUCC0719]